MNLWGGGVGGYSHTEQNNFFADYVIACVLR